MLDLKAIQEIKVLLALQEILVLAEVPEIPVSLVTLV